MNAFFPAQNLFKPVIKEGQEAAFGKAAVGMTRQYARGLHNHKEAILDAFKKIIPVLDDAFPEHTIVVRPHPTENQQIYRDIALRCRRVSVTNEGNVVPWLMATRAVIHNGCTTGVEAYMMDVPALSYRAKVDEEYDLGFYRLPNLISHQCFNADELIQTLDRIFKGQLGVADGDDRKALVNQYLAAQDGPLACERIMDVIEQLLSNQPDLPKPSLGDRLLGRSLSLKRRLSRQLRSRLPGSHAPPEFHKHRYPGATARELNARISRFQQLLGDKSTIIAEQLTDQIFSVSLSEG